MISAEEHAAPLLELADQLEHDRRCPMDDRNWIVPLADRARAAAAELGERVIPTENELIREAIAVGLVFQPRDEYDEVYLPFDSDEPLDDLIVAYGRAVLARFGGGDVT